MNRQFCSLLIFLGLFCHTSFSQTFRYTAGVTEAGIYTLSAEQARKLGFQRLEEVAIYGYPGMLPQRLDSAQLSPQEIPSLLAADQLYFFLEGQLGGILLVTYPAYANKPEGIGMVCHIIYNTFRIGSCLHFPGQWLSA
jgi:hypothetical protein